MEERRFRAFKNRVLRRIFRPQREKVTEVWRKLHEKKLNDLYSSPNIIRAIKSRRMRWAGHVACMEEKRDAYRVLVGKPEGKGPLERPRLDGRIIARLIFTKWDGGIDWNDLAQDRDRWQALVNAEMNNLLVP
jgi:hypothetical protein